MTDAATVLPTSALLAPQFAGWRQVLVPIRGGRDALLRVELALRLAQATGARVTALYVVDDRLLADPDIGVRTALDLTEQLRQEGEAVLAQAAQLAGAAVAPGVAIEGRIEQGPVVETILRVAEELEADAIVVGAHKQTWLGRLLGGSLAEAVMRTSKFSVLAVAPGDAAAAPGGRD